MDDAEANRGGGRAVDDETIFGTVNFNLNVVVCHLAGENVVDMSITRRGLRFVGLVIVVAIASACLYFRKDWMSPVNAKEHAGDLASGYLSPSTVLPDYISPHGIPSCPSDSNIGRYAGVSSGEDDRIRTSKVEEYVAQHLQAKQAHFDPEADREWLGIDLGAWDLPTYRQELVETYERYFSNGSEAPEYIHLVSSRLALRSHATYPERPRQILTTTKEMPLPKPFQRWRSLHRGYKLRIFDDERMAQWVDAAFGGTRGKEVWDSLPRAVLKTDVFRYVIC
jgi:hypothetical protein